MKAYRMIFYVKDTAVSKDLVRTVEEMEDLKKDWCRKPSRKVRFREVEVSERCFTMPSYRLAM